MEEVKIMRTTMLKRYFCLLLVLMFVIPSVAAFNAGIDINGNDNFEISKKTMNNQKAQKGIDFSFIPASEMSIEVREILTKYSLDDLDEPLKEQLKTLNQNMLERREQFTSEYPYLPYTPLDLTKILAKYDIETGLSKPAFPGADITNTPEPYKWEDSYQNQPVWSNIPNSQLYEPQSSETNAPTGSRGTRQAADADLEVYSVEWEAINDGFGNYFEITEINGTPYPGTQYYEGGFQVGVENTITVTIRRNSGPSSISNVKVNISIYDTITNKPMQRNPTAKVVTVSGVSTEVTHKFTPPYATEWMTIVATVDYEGDTDITNNANGWQRIPVLIWSADFESGGTNWGWQKTVSGTTITNTQNQWTGDIGTSTVVSNQWHVSNSPANIVSADHTGTNAWYHGFDGVASDSYEDSSANMLLQTPEINMGDISDGQAELGELQEDYYYIPYVPYYSVMVTGGVEWDTTDANTWQDAFDQSDPVWLREYSDDHGVQWWDKMFNWRGFIIDDYAQVLSGINPGHLWNPIFNTIFVNNQEYFFGYHFPFNVLLGDGSGGNKDIGGAENWTHVQFRADFRGDNGGDDGGFDGAYLDDFITLGGQDFTVENRVSLTDVTYPKTNNVPILYKGKTASFSTKCKNFGTQQQVNMKVTITDMDGNTVSGFPQQKSAGNLANDQESNPITWTWSPAEEGDYKLIVEAGDYENDWTYGDNKVENYILHVGPADDVSDVDILLVDDDNSMGQAFILGRVPYFFINVEGKMMKALEDNDMKFRVYTVEYNQSGPTYADVMDDYETVIWMTGLDNEYSAHGWRENYKSSKAVWNTALKTGSSGTGEDVEELGKFLSDPNEVKKLWLISPGYWYDIYEASTKVTAPADFANQYLFIDRGKANATEWNNDRTQITVQGTPNPLEGKDDTIMDSASYTTYDKPDPPLRFNDIGGWVLKKTDKDTQQLFYQDSARLNFNSILHKGKEFMTSYFAFNFYLINDENDRKDCVYRVLTGFGMTGGVEISLHSETKRTQTVAPDGEIYFRFIVKNTGKRDDQMKLKVSADTKYNDWETWFEIDGIKKDTVTIQGLKDKNRVYLYVQAPEMDKPSEYLAADTLVDFTVTAESQNTGLDNSTTVFAKVAAIGDITLDSNELSKTIDVKGVAKFQLEMLNETNGELDTNVLLKFSGAGMGLTKFVVKGVEASSKQVQTILEPNEINDDVEIWVTAGEHTLAGYHNISVVVKDEDDIITYDIVNLSVKVNQFYQVECNTTGDEDNAINFIIDPNEYAEDDVNNITKSFSIFVRNYGNGMDEISLYTEENEDSEDISDWEFRIRDPDDETELLETVTVGYYDETNLPAFGYQEVTFDVVIPIDVDVGTYIVDFYIESSHPEVLNPLVNEEENNRVSFTFEIIKPNLRFTPFNSRDNADNYVFTDYYENLPIKRDFMMNNQYYIEKKHSEFDQLAIEIKVMVDNIGDNEIALEPSNVQLNISYKDPDFGDTRYVTPEGNFTPTFPTSAKIIDFEEPNNNETFTFLWEFIDQPQGTEIEYTFKVIVDEQGKIYEIDEDDNTDTFTLTIKHLKKPKKSSSGTPGFEGILMVTAIALVLVALIGSRRRRND